MSKTESRHSHISQVAPFVGIPKNVKNPIHPHRFERIAIAKLAEASPLAQFGVNMVSLKKDVYSSLRHWHEVEDEFVYVLSGHPTLIDNNGEVILKAGSFAAFPAGEANAHHFVNRNDEIAELLVIGSRKPGEDVCHYPDDPVGPVDR